MYTDYDMSLSVYKECLTNKKYHVTSNIRNLLVSQEENQKAISRSYHIDDDYLIDMFKQKVYSHPKDFRVILHGISIHSKIDQFHLNDYTVQSHNTLDVYYDIFDPDEFSMSEKLGYKEFLYKRRLALGGIYNEIR